MTLKNAKELMDHFYKFAVFSIDKRHLDLYKDGVYRTFCDKTYAIVQACICTNDSNRVWRQAQKYKFQLEDKLEEYYRNRETV